MSSPHDPETLMPDASLMQSARILEEWAAELNQLADEWYDDHQQTLTLLITELRQCYPQATSFIDALHEAVAERQAAYEELGCCEAEETCEPIATEEALTDARVAKRQRLGALPPRLVAKILRKAGFTLREGSGSHVVVTDDQGNNSLISMNGGFGGDLGPKHLNGIAKQLRIDPRKLFAK